MERFRDGAKLKSMTLILTQQIKRTTTPLILQVPLPADRAIPQHHRMKCNLCDKTYPQYPVVFQGILLLFYKTFTIQINSSESPLQTPKQSAYTPPYLCPGHTTVNRALDNDRFHPPCGLSLQSLSTRLLRGRLECSSAA